MRLRITLRRFLAATTCAVLAALALVTAPESAHAANLVGRVLDYQSNPLANFRLSFLSNAGTGSAAIYSAVSGADGRFSTPVQAANNVQMTGFTDPDGLPVWFGGAGGWKNSIPQFGVSDAIETSLGDFLVGGRIDLSLINATSGVQVKVFEQAVDQSSWTAGAWLDIVEAERFKYWLKPGLTYTLLVDGGSSNVQTQFIGGIPADSNATAVPAGVATFTLDQSGETFTDQFDLVLKTVIPSPEPTITDAPSTPTQTPSETPSVTPQPSSSANNTPSASSTPPPAPQPGTSSATVVVPTASNTASASVAPRKIKPTVSVKKLSKGRIQVTVKAVGQAKPTGKLSITWGKKKLSVTLKASHKGKVIVKQPKRGLKKGKNYRVAVTYSGSAIISSAKAKVIRLKAI